MVFRKVFPILAFLNISDYANTYILFQKMCLPALKPMYIHYRLHFFLRYICLNSMLDSDRIPVLISYPHIYPQL